MLCDGIIQHSLVATTSSARSINFADVHRAAAGSRIAALGALSQLQDLQLDHVASNVTVSQLGAALSPLTRLSRLSVEFGGLPNDFEGSAMDCLPDAVCALTGLRSLRFGGLEFGFGNGVTPSLTQLRRLEHLELRGWVQRDLAAAAEDIGQPTLSDFPAMQSAVLRLRVQVGHNGRHHAVCCARHPLNCFTDCMQSLPNSTLSWLQHESDPNSFSSHDTATQPQATGAGWPAAAGASPGLAASDGASVALADGGVVGGAASVDRAPPDRAAHGGCRGAPAGGCDDVARCSSRASGASSM